ncbi:hypothetical protein Dda_6235 [Drechslerella dactyloides]|uniref:Uncharacterized protein n=1 Tax=Drechslerella dactyloides TaxID=74499 RepID=A0AAD6IXF7_DREDA|nr:hypothetical protein Dda_6235 [Drechslerella dactyloides]
MPRCHKIWYPECRRTVLILLNAAYAEKDALPSAHDPSITPEQRARLVELRREIVQLHADVKFISKTHTHYSSALLWSPGGATVEDGLGSW